MDVDDTNLLVELIKALLASSASDPVVLYSEPLIVDTIRLLPSEWQMELTDESSFASRVSGELASRPVIAFPPWGRQQGSPVAREAAALEGVRPGASNHPLLLVLPDSNLTSQASKQLRMDLATQWQFSTVATCVGGLKEARAALMIALVLLKPIMDAPAVLKMFQAPLDWRSSTELVVDDLQHLLRRSGGTTEFGYVLPEQPAAGAPLDHRLHDPRIARRRAELVDYGRVTSLDRLFHIFTGRPAQALHADRVDADTPAACRLIFGRDVLRTHMIAPPDDVTVWVNTPYAELEAGDIVIASVHGNHPLYPGLLWARVSEADVPSIPSHTVVVLHPQPSTSSDEVEFVLRYLSSRHALELSEEPHVWLRGSSRVTAAALKSLSVPLPDEHLAEALRSVESARRRAAQWADEADRILDALFEYDSANMSRQNVIERTRVVRLRIQAVDDVETLSGQVRTQYPLPIAYSWRVFEAVLSTGPSREAYHAALDCAEQTLAFAANVGLALAREAGTDVSTLKAIGTKLARRQGPSMADWSNVLDELKGKAFSSIDDVVATTEFRDFCRDAAVADARRELLKRRNDESHQRRVESTLLGDACDTVVRHLAELLRALEFWLDNPLVIAKLVHWDSFENAGSLTYQRLAGDHPIVQTREMRIDSPNIESDSLYLLDSNRKMHLLRPFLVGTNCMQCGTFSIFHIDQYLNGSLSLKSMEHGHTIEASEPLSRAFEATGLLDKPTG